MSVRLWGNALASFGSIDIWVSNAGLARTTPSMIEHSREDVEAMVMTNMGSRRFKRGTPSLRYVTTPSGRVLLN